MRPGKSGSTAVERRPTRRGALGLERQWRRWSDLSTGKGPHCPWRVRQCVFTVSRPPFTHHRGRPSQRGALLGRFPYRGRQTAGINSPADGTIAAAWFSARHERAAMTVGRGDEASGFCRGARWLRHACHRLLLSARSSPPPRDIRFRWYFPRSSQFMQASHKRGRPLALGGSKERPSGDGGMVVFRLSVPLHPAKQPVQGQPYSG